MSAWRGGFVDIGSLRGRGGHSRQSGQAGEEASFQGILQADNRCRSSMVILDGHHKWTAAGSWGLREYLSSWLIT